MNVDAAKVAVIGLGYVGLPLAVEFGKKRQVIGFDIDLDRIEQLQNDVDKTLEVDFNDLHSSDVLYTSDPAALKNANVYIVTTPTPIDRYKRPDLRPLLMASQTVGKVLKCGDIVIYESTVYPGATEEDCVPVLERESDLVFNEDFFVGYSPERINPGDKEHRLSTIVKVTSGSTTEAADFVDRLYSTIISAGTYKAQTIKVAEAAKVIENTQRDVNIALINELAVLFEKLGIDTGDVLDAAGTKWNFLPFRPGLVGGHCIGVDPYYLTHRAQEIGHHPELILAGRRLNDSMGAYVATQLIKIMAARGLNIRGAKVLLLGITFKENTPDLRNSRVIDIIDELRQFDVDLDTVDPWVDPLEARYRYGISPLSELPDDQYEAIVLAVAHQQFIGLTADDLRQRCRDRGVIFDLKGLLPRGTADLRL